MEERKDPEDDFEESIKLESNIPEKKKWSRYGGRWALSWDEGCEDDEELRARHSRRAKYGKSTNPAMALSVANQQFAVRVIECKTKWM
jgi:hypothetical protein